MFVHDYHPGSTTLMSRHFGHASSNLKTFRNSLNGPFPGSRGKGTVDFLILSFDIKDSNATFSGGQNPYFIFKMVYKVISVLPVNTSPHRYICQLSFVRGVQWDVSVIRKTVFSEHSITIHSISKVRYIIMYCLLCVAYSEQSSFCDFWYSTPCNFTTFSPFLTWTTLCCFRCA